MKKIVLSLYEFLFPSYNAKQLGKDIAFEIKKYEYYKKNPVMSSLSNIRPKKKLGGSTGSYKRFAKATHEFESLPPVNKPKKLELFNTNYESKLPTTNRDIMKDYLKTHGSDKELKKYKKYIEHQKQRQTNIDGSKNASTDAPNPISVADMLSNSIGSITSLFK